MSSEKIPMRTANHRHSNDGLVQVIAQIYMQIIRDLAHEDHKTRYAREGDLDESSHRLQKIFIEKHL
jgi:hypothetical protein